MNNFILAIADILRGKGNVKEWLNNFLVKEVKSYYDLEGSLRLAVKVFNTYTNEDEIFILNLENIEDFDDSVIEDKNKWFEELN